ncbi:MAG: ArnT family glycosyltransferase [Bacteroidia bacterium]
MKISTPSKGIQAVMIVGLLFLLYFGLGIFKTIPLRPQSIHQWAQCDRASVALNYAQESMNFFLPRVHNLDNGTGITGMEFPFVNYSVGVLYRIFGVHEYLYRLFVLSFFTCGLIFAFLIAKKFTKHFYFSAGIMLLFACSPLLAFYGSNFLPEPVSLALSIMAWYTLIQASESAKKNKWLLLWCIFFSLAALIKISALVNLPAMVVFYYFQSPDNQRWKSSLPIVLGSFLIVVLTFSWYKYAIILSEAQHSEMFLLQSRPPQSLEEFKEVWSEVYKIWWERVYENVLLFMVLAGVVGALFLKSLRESRLLIIVIVLMATIAVFLYLMWLQLQHHDYYMIPLYTLILFSMIITVEFLRKFKAKWITVTLALLMLFGISFQFAMAKNHLRTSYKIDSWKYGSLHFNNYFDLESILLSSGVKPNDKVISVFDHSPEISLYLMNRKGVTVSYRKSKFVFRTYLNSGQFNYIVYNTQSNYDDISFNSVGYPLKEIFNNKVIIIYKIELDSLSNKIQVNTPIMLSPWN